MKNSLVFKFWLNLCTLILFVVCFSANSQTPIQNSQTKKDQVYKNQQMFDSKTGSTDLKTKRQRLADDAIKRAAYEYMRLKDPATGKVPDNIRKAELNFSNKIAVGQDSKRLLSKASKSLKSADYYYWRNRGPFNVGGRTRAIAIDRVNENIILAGGVSGGLWRTENGGVSWRKVTRSFQTPSVTAIVQDPRPRNSHIWYYASGEYSGNTSTSAGGGAYYQGDGVYKSQDGGRTWEQLKATENTDIAEFNSGFDYINSMIINPTNGDLYVATYNGLFRTKDGGNSFSEVLQGGVDNIVEVSVTSTGRIYATIPTAGVPNAGFFTSTDGDTWTNITLPSSFSLNYSRAIMAIDPSDENVVYFFTNNERNTAALYKYDASATTIEDTWVDLTANLPFSIEGFGGLNLQGGYNMMVKVHPTDSNIVFIGGTNLYRSTTGFTTPAGRESWIAGYDKTGLAPLLNTARSYTNQHPDMHALVFYPSNPDKALNANDGGVYMTEDITDNIAGEEPVSWTSLNNGYTTTQPYHVSIDPESNTDDLLAGFQDNGSWFTNSMNPTDSWKEELGADGTYTAIADGGKTHYVAAQSGLKTVRLNFDEEGNNTSFTTITPSAASNFTFVNPFILDPNNDNIMYMPVGTGIWRNNNLDEIPLFSNNETSVNWVDITTSETTDKSRIRALDVSKFPVANRLYYGTDSGMVFRMDNANIDNQPAIDISTGKGLPGGFINDINVDPSDTDRVIVTYSNYGIPSLFITEDGGDTWTDISGNLEENTDGTGNGPSVRSTAFHGGSQGSGGFPQRVFAATSTGLYYTFRLNGQNTVWIKEQNVIGEAVTDEVVTRKDGLVAVAAHGDGMFSARLPIDESSLPESTLRTAFLLDDFEILQNTQETKEIDIAGLFVQSEGLPIHIEMTNSNPELVTATMSGTIVKLSYAPDAIGTASIGFIGTSGEEQVSEGFTVTILEPAIYEQTNSGAGKTASQNFLDFGGLAQAADDFIVPVGNTWSIKRLLAFGTLSGRVLPSLNNVTIVIYNDESGLPGEEIYNSGEIEPISGIHEADLNIQLPEAVTLESGNYWISIYVNLAFSNNQSQWKWISQDNTVGEETQFKDDLDLFGTGAVDWTPYSVAMEENQRDQRFRIFGDIIGSDIRSDGEEPLVILDSEISSLAWPNPSSGQFNFNLNTESLGEKVKLSIYDISGKLVHQNVNFVSKNNYVWDASAMTSGFYFVKIDGENTSKRFKIMKR